MPQISVEFSGGMELLFDGKKTLPLSMEENTRVRDLIQVLKTKHLKERPELFVQGDTVRPGILVLINDTDWELEGELDYVLKEKDNVVFISTLHGG